jgi:hypothetical protein
MATFHSMLGETGLAIDVFVGIVNDDISKLAERVCALEDINDDRTQTELDKHVAVPLDPFPAPQWAEQAMDNYRATIQELENRVEVAEQRVDAYERYTGFGRTAIVDLAMVAGDDLPPCGTVSFESQQERRSKELADLRDAHNALSSAAHPFYKEN